MRSAVLAALFAVAVSAVAAATEEIPSLAKDHLGQRVSSAPSHASGYVVWLGTRFSEPAAQIEFKALQSRYPKVLGEHSALIVRVDGTMGTIYRVGVGPFTTGGEAGVLCVQLKAASGSCEARPADDTRSLSDWAPSPKRSDAPLSTDKDMTDGVRVSEEECKALPSVIWLHVRERDFCVRYWLSTASGTNDEALIYSHGDISDVIAGTMRLSTIWSLRYLTMLRPSPTLARKDFGSNDRRRLVAMTRPPLHRESWKSEPSIIMGFFAAKVAQ